MQHKVVIVRELTDTTITIGGTVYFATDKEAQDFVKHHNQWPDAKAYIVQVASDYSVVDHSKNNRVI